MHLLQLVTLTFIGTTVVGQDCSKLLNKKRFILDTVNYYYNKLPRQVREVLPGNTEVDSNCRFDLLSLTDTQKQTLKTLYNDNYTLCVGCGYTDSDKGRCHSIDVCQKGSVCIAARNGDTRQYVPSYYWHGCCNPSDVECQERVEDIVFSFGGGYNPTMRYPKDVCSGPICNENGFTTEKDALIKYLTTMPTAPTVVDGNWGEWGPWSPCDRSCNFGIKMRMRTCSAPVPQNGGMDCSGFDKQSDICNAIQCP